MSFEAARCTLVGFLCGAKRAVAAVLAAIVAPVQGLSSFCSSIFQFGSVGKGPLLH